MLISALVKFIDIILEEFETELYTLRLEENRQLLAIFVMLLEIFLQRTTTRISEDDSG